MQNSSRRITVAGAAAIGAALMAGARSVAGVAFPKIAITAPRRVNENGMPFHKHIGSHKTGHSVAHGKRLAKKARNRARAKARQ